MPNPALLTTWKNSCFSQNPYYHPSAGTGNKEIKHLLPQTSAFGSEMHITLFSPVHCKEDHFKKNKHIILPQEVSAWKPPLTWHLAYSHKQCAHLLMLKQSLQSCIPLTAVVRKCSKKKCFTNNKNKVVTRNAQAPLSREQEVKTSGYPHECAHARRWPFPYTPSLHPPTPRRQVPHHFLYNGAIQKVP